MEIKKISEQLNENRVKQGLPPIPETTTETKPPIEKAKETAPKVPVKSVEEYISELIDWMEEISYISPEFAEELRAKYLGGGAADFSGKYVGTWTWNSVDENGGSPFTDSGGLTITVKATNKIIGEYSFVLAFADGSAIKGGTYSETTGTITVDKATGIGSFRIITVEGGPINGTFNNGNFNAMSSESGLTVQYTATKQ